MKQIAAIVIFAALTTLSSARAGVSLKDKNENCYPDGLETETADCSFTLTAETKPTDENLPWRRCRVDPKKDVFLVVTGSFRFALGPVNFGYQDGWYRFGYAEDYGKNRYPPCQMQMSHQAVVYQGECPTEKTRRARVYLEAKICEPDPSRVTRDLIPSGGTYVFSTKSDEEGYVRARINDSTSKDENPYADNEDHPDEPLTVEVFVRN